MNADELKAKLSDQWWRLNNLYYITDKSGKAVKFTPNKAQREFYWAMHYLNVILKARQLGFSTFIDLYLLDQAVFNENVRCGIIAHNKEDAKNLFTDKVKFAYDRLPEALRKAVPSDTDSKFELVFANGSSIRVGTSMRSGTVQFLHVSEYGKISRKYPDKAKEIKTGAFQAVADGFFIFVESTAEGREGEFYDLVKAAQDHAAMGRELGSQDFKLHFFPWWAEPTYRTNPKDVPITSVQMAYFLHLESKYGIKVDAWQRAWYVKKRDGTAGLGEDMKREYPSTPEEAFEASIEGAYYAPQIDAARRQGRVTKVPVESGVLVDTWWDLGMNDSMTIWFTQTIGREIHVIDYYENVGEGFDHYARILREREYAYGIHTAPHDIKVRLMDRQGKTRKQIAAEAGIRFEVAPSIGLLDGIEAVRRILSICWFDEERTDQGFVALENYRKEWDDRLGCFKDKPLHNWASHGADGFRTLAVAWQAATQQVVRAQAVTPVQRGAWT